MEKFTLEDLEELEALLSKAWNICYDKSKGQFEGFGYKARMAINDIQCEILDEKERNKEGK